MALPVAAVREYPWYALERMTRRDVRRARAARQALRGTDGRGASAALTELLGGEVELVVRDVGRARLPAGAREVVLRIDERTHFGLALEPDGVQALLSRVLGRPLGLPRQELDLGNALAGAAAALVIQVARRLTGAPAVLASAPTTEPFELEATLLFEEQAFALALRAWVDAPPERPAAARERLGQLEVELPLVVGLSLGQRGELASLAAGDAWFPGEGLWIDRSGQGRGALSAPASELGIWVDLAPGGSIVLRGGCAELRADAEPTMADSSPQDSLESLVAEAPVVVRVELGTVSVNAGDVAALQPGDVIETGKRVGEPVVLRVAGRAIARGDLVDVEGELGVRIREILRQEP